VADALHLEDPTGHVDGVGQVGGPEFNVLRQRLLKLLEN